MTLAEQINIYNTLREQLLTSGYDFTDDDQALLDTLEGETNIHEQIAAVIRDARRAEAMADGLADIIKDNQYRKSRMEVRSERLRKLAFDAMQSCGIPKIESPDLTISIAKGAPHVVITDQTLLPDGLYQIEIVPNKKEIRNRLKFGEFVPGAEWSNAQPILKVHSR